MANRLNNFIKCNLGLERDKLSLVDHNPRWTRLYSDEATLLFHSLRIEDLRLYHCGSTPVSTIKSKPILDIIGSVENIEVLDQKKQTFERLGYEFKGEYGIEGRRYCVLYDSEKKIGYCHLHLYQHDSLEVADHLKFRDTLINNWELAAKYEAKKESLLNDSSVTRSNYSTHKDQTISSIIKKTEDNVSKILIVAASGEGGNNTTTYATSLFGEGRVVRLSDLKLQHYSYEPTIDVNSGFISLIKEMIASDLIVFATPVYWYSMSAAMKLFFDNLSYLLDGDYKELGEKLSFKKIKLVSTGSDAHLPTGFEVPFIQTAIYFGMDYLGIHYASSKQKF